MKAFKAHDYLGLTKEQKRKKSKKKHVRSYCEKDTGGGCTVLYVARKELCGFAAGKGGKTQKAKNMCTVEEGGGIGDLWQEKGRL